MGQKFVNRTGQFWLANGKAFRVMVSKENWHMCRYPGSIPFTVSEHEFKDLRMWRGSSSGGTPISRMTTEGEDHDQNPG